MGWWERGVVAGRSRRSEWHEVVQREVGRLKSYADDSSAALRGVLLTDEERSETGVVGVYEDEDWWA